MPRIAEHPFDIGARCLARMSAIPILVIVLMLAVLVVLALGLIHLVRGTADEASARRSNRLMSWRVALQGAALLLLGLLMLLTEKG